MAVAKRQCGEYSEALEILQQALGVSVRALVDEKERLVTMGMYLGDGWMDQVIRGLDLENSSEWITYEESKIAMATIVPSQERDGGGTSIRSESECGGSSSGSQARSITPGGYSVNEDGSGGVRKLSARSFLGKELNGRRISGKSSTLGKEIDGRKLSDSIRTGITSTTYGKDIDSARKVSIKSESSGNSGTSREPGLLRDPANSKTIHGPPLVILFLDLLTNFGNVLFNLGQIEESIDSHSNCLRLAESVLEYFPLDTEFRMSFPLAVSWRLSAAMTGVIPTPPPPPPASLQQEKSFFHDPNLPIPAPNHKIHLSYLHRSIILAQTRSLTLLGVCCQSLGLDDAAVQCNSHAFEIIAFYKKYSVVGGMASCQEVEISNGGGGGGSSGGGGEADKEEVEESMKQSSISMKENRKSNANAAGELAQKQAQWQMQLEQEEKTRVYTRELVDPLIGMVLANFAASYYAKGRPAAAFNQLIEASQVFKTLNFTLPLARVRSSIAALKVHLGHSFKNLHWSKLMEMVVSGTSSAEEAAVYWQPLGLESAARRHYGSIWATPGWMGLKQSFKIFKEKNDLGGMLLAMLNMASAQLTNNEPFIALYILGSMLMEETESGKSLSSTAEAIITNSPRIPEHLKLQTHYLLCQSIYLIYRYKKPETNNYGSPPQRQPPPFPESLFPKVIFFDKEQEQMLFCDLEPIQKLAISLSPQIDNVLDLNLLASEFLASFHILELQRDEIVQGVHYSLLFPYIGASGFARQSNVFDTLSRTSNSDNNGIEGGGGGGGGDGNRPGPKNQHVFGIGVGIDFKTQQSLLIRSMMGKNDWVEASYNHEQGDFYILSELFRQSVDNMDFVAKDLLELLNLGDGSVSETLGMGMTGLRRRATMAASQAAARNSRGMGNESGGGGGGVRVFDGFVSSLYQLGPILEKIPPTQSTETAAARENPRHIPACLSVSQFIAAVQTSSFAASNMFAVSSDILVSTAYLIKNYSRFKEELVVSLKFKQHGGVTPDRMMKLLLDAYTASVRSGLGMCESCLKDLMEGISVYEPEIVYVSPSGVVLGPEENIIPAPPNSSSSSSSSYDHDQLRDTLEGQGKFSFPCRHFNTRSL
ncbi:hypothetical protein BDR26DRAFT_866201 [Obelidium mucronatum]|nr:hypothetical protein BDR26DRAFT_866201 [Obelidium mucronatum]